MQGEMKILRFIHVYFVVGVLFSISYFVSVRDSDVGSDTSSYEEFFYRYLKGEEFRISEPLFLLLAELSQFFSHGHILFFFIISSVSSISLLLVAYKLFKDLDWERRAPLYIMVFLTMVFFSPFYLNGQINLLRSALAVPFLFIGSFCLYKKKYYSSAAFFLISSCFHFTSIIFLPALFFFKIENKRILYIVSFLSVFYLLGVPEVVFYYLSEYLEHVVMFDYYRKYAEGASGYKAGVRFDFWAFSFLFFVFCFYLRNRNYLFDFCFKFYGSLMVPFLLLGFIAYSDRLLFPAWMFLPFIFSGFVVFYIKPSPVFCILSFFSLLGSLFWFCFYSGVIGGNIF